MTGVEPAIADVGRFAGSPRLLPRRWRATILTIHIVVAVGALGTEAALLSLGLTGLVSSDPDLIRAAYVAMDVVVASVMLPLALAAVLSGLLLALGTHWGLARHYWVLAKLILTLTVATAALLMLRPAVSQAAAHALAIPLDELAASGIGESAVRVTTAPAIGVAVLVVVAAIAVVKPWGVTSRRRR